jgi:hypothetical protein
MEITQAIETLKEKNDKQCVLALTLKHGETVNILGGLIQIEVDLEYHSSRPLLRFKAPKFIDIFRSKRT